MSISVSGSGFEFMHEDDIGSIRSVEISADDIEKLLEVADELSGHLEPTSEQAAGLYRLGAVLDSCEQPELVDLRTLFLYVNKINSRRDIFVNAEERMAFRFLGAGLGDAIRPTVG